MQYICLQIYVNTRKSIHSVCVYACKNCIIMQDKVWCNMYSWHCRVSLIEKHCGWYLFLNQLCTFQFRHMPHTSYHPLGVVKHHTANHNFFHTTTLSCHPKAAMFSGCMGWTWSMDLVQTLSETCWHKYIHTAVLHNISSYNDIFWQAPALLWWHCRNMIQHMGPCRLCTTILSKSQQFM